MAAFPATVLDAVARALHCRWHPNPALRQLLDAGSPDPAYLLDRRREYLGFTTPPPAIS